MILLASTSDWSADAVMTSESSRHAFRLRANEEDSVIGRALSASQEGKK
jgi:hypothetical protein